MCLLTIYGLKAVKNAFYGDDATAIEPVPHLTYIFISVRRQFEWNLFANRIDIDQNRTRTRPVNYKLALELRSKRVSGVSMWAAENPLISC